MTEDAEIDFSRVMHFRELHIQLLRIFYRIKEPIAPKEIIERFAAERFGLMYSPKSVKSSKYKVTDAKIYSGIIFLEKENLIIRTSEPNQVSRTNPPLYIISEGGKRLVEEDTLLGLQNFYAMIIMGFLTSKVDKLIELGLDDHLNLGIIGSKQVIIPAILGPFLGKRSIYWDFSYKMRKIYFFDTDSLVQSLDEDSEMISQSPLILDSYFSKANIVLQPVRCVENEVILDIESDKIDFVISLMTFSDIPDVCFKTIQEIHRILRPGGGGIIVELNLNNSIVTWVIRKLMRESIDVLPVVFQNIFRREGLGTSFDSEILEENMTRVFGSSFEIEDFKDLIVAYFSVS